MAIDHSRCKWRCVAWRFDHCQIGNFGGTACQFVFGSRRPNRHRESVHCRQRRLCRLSCCKRCLPDRCGQRCHSRRLSAMSAYLFPASNRRRASGFTIHIASETADADPGDGFIRFNNAAPLSAAEIYVSKTDGNGIDQSAFLATLDDANTWRAIAVCLILHSPDQSAVFVGQRDRHVNR